MLPSTRDAASHLSRRAAAHITLIRRLQNDPIPVVCRLRRLETTAQPVQLRARELPVDRLLFLLCQGSVCDSGRAETVVGLMSANS